MEEVSKSLWNKKADELTVGESVKVAGAATIISMAAPLVTLLVVGGVIHLKDKFKERRANKKMKTEK